MATPLDPRQPVLIGVSQIKQHPEDPADALEATSLMAETLRLAAADSGAPESAQSLDMIGVVNGGWRYPDPGRLVADSVGAAKAKTLLTSMGGNTPQALLNHFCTRIQKGEFDVAAVVGGEVMWSRRRQKKAGTRKPVTMQEGVLPDEEFGVELAMATGFESSRGLNLPIDYYPLAESALRAARGETIDQHRQRISELWHRFNQVAVTNPYAWSQVPLTAEQIATPGPGNRMVGFPYTKAMNSNWDLDLGAAVIVASVEAAERLGVPRDRWIFPLGGTEAYDTLAVSERRDFHSSPAITAAGQALFDQTGFGPDDIAHLDLYSCFPVAVQIAADALGIGLDRQLTQTGGLTFAGGPLNNYVTHSLAAMTQTLRQDPDSVGLVTANGGFVTKHALGLFSGRPPEGAFIATDVQDIAEEVPRHEVDEAYAGLATIEAYTVMHDANGPTHALCALQTPAGARTWGRVLAADQMASMMLEEAIGQSGNLDAEGVLSL